ncbi:MAG: sigma-70 family RNA polymerase sigma factor [Sinobacteraceae bacterium]|nr:sigma-70 family RNA polymerase sigma factor [Nevskiaceae bacterium]
MLEHASCTSIIDASSARLPAGRAELPDLLLVERSRARDRRAFQKLMERYNRRLFRVARSILSEDDAAEEVVRVSYVRAIEELDRCEPSGRFGAWLTRATFNHAQTARRQVLFSGPSARHIEAVATKVAPRSGDGAAVSAVESATEPAVEPAVAPADAVRQAEVAIDALPEVFRTVLILRTAEGLSGVEVAACLGLHETTVRTRLYRAQHRMSPEIVRTLRDQGERVFALSAERSARIMEQVLDRP